MRILIDNGNTPAAPRPYIGHYGRLRKAYLEQYRPDLYTALVANEKLHEHCAEIDEAARSRIDLIMPQLARSAGATEALKATAPMKWVGLMNACRAQAEEIAKFELIYVLRSRAGKNRNPAITAAPTIHSLSGRFLFENPHFPQVKSREKHPKNAPIA